MKAKKCLVHEVLELCGVPDTDRLADVLIHVTPNEFTITCEHNAIGPNGAPFRLDGNNNLVKYTKKYKLVEVEDESNT